MKRLTAYLSGPMTGYPGENRQAFKDATARLRTMGYEVVSPDELDGIDPAKSQEWETLLSRDVRHVPDCDLIVVLPGWKHSRGATLEVLIMHQLKRPVMSFPAMQPVPLHELPVPTFIGAPNTDEDTR